VRLVVVADPVYDVEGRDALAEQDGRLSRALDLSDRTLRQPGCRGDPALHRACADHRQQLAFDGVRDEWVALEHAFADQPVDEHLGVVEVGQGPLLPAKHEALRGHVRALKVLVDQERHRQVGHRRSVREGDPERRRLVGHEGRARCGLGAADGGLDAAVLLPDDELPVRRRHRGHPLDA
jgi:hypothetical protein